MRENWINKWAICADVTPVITALPGDVSNRLYIHASLLVSDCYVASAPNPPCYHLTPTTQLQHVYFDPVAMSASVDYGNVCVVFPMTLCLENKKERGEGQKGQDEHAEEKTDLLSFKLDLASLSMIDGIAVTPVSVTDDSSAFVVEFKGEKGYLLPDSSEPFDCIIWYIDAGCMERYRVGDKRSYWNGDPADKNVKSPKDRNRLNQPVGEIVPVFAKPVHMWY